MKKPHRHILQRIVFSVLMLCAVFLLTGCGRVSRAAEEARQTYNEEAERYNATVEEYNQQVSLLEEERTKLAPVLEEAGEAADSGDEPEEPETLTLLQTAIETAEEALPESLTALTPEHVDPIEFTQRYTNSTLKRFTADATAAIEAFRAFDPPELPEVPDTDALISGLRAARSAYETSVETRRERLRAEAEENGEIPEEEETGAAAAEIVFQVPAEYSIDGMTDYALTAEEYDALMEAVRTHIQAELDRIAGENFHIESITPDEEYTVFSAVINTVPISGGEEQNVLQAFELGKLYAAYCQREAEGMRVDFCNMKGDVLRSVSQEAAA